mmetsp:Transcript_35826/g.99298  ORF Transcript_35826/g.99298 Transcript_35826/m.99298 type:complete len:201 (+) Transcript_35826:119-721(+)
MIFSSSTIKDLILKSTPMVAVNTSEKVSSINLKRSADLPTPLLPINRSLNRKVYSEKLPCGVSIRRAPLRTRCSANLPSGSEGVKSFRLMLSDNTCVPWSKRNRDTGVLFASCSDSKCFTSLTVAVPGNASSVTSSPANVKMLSSTVCSLARTDWSLERSCSATARRAWASSASVDARIPAANPAGAPAPMARFMSCLRW